MEGQKQNFPPLSPTFAPSNKNKGKTQTTKASLLNIYERLFMNSSLKNIKKESSKILFYKKNIKFFVNSLKKNKKISVPKNEKRCNQIKFKKINK